jgi:hypothetical protein
VTLHSYGQAILYPFSDGKRSPYQDLLVRFIENQYVFNLAFLFQHQTASEMASAIERVDGRKFTASRLSDILCESLNATLINK